MKPGTICIIRPNTGRTRGGNDVTASRWESIFRELGWDVRHNETWDGEPCDVLLALHARKSHDSVLRFKRAHSNVPIVVAGTGTDLYSDVPDGGEVRESLGLATRIVVLQGHAVDALPVELRDRAHVIYQSIAPPTERAPFDPDSFDVVYFANVRPVKDPLTAVRAARLLPADSRVRILHFGGMLDEGLGAELARELAQCVSFVSKGEVEHAAALRALSGSRLLLSTSRHEGGANAVSEALAYDVPVVATRIPGSLGLLGDDYPGCFEVGDAQGLADLLVRASTDEVFYHRLREACREQASLTARETEVENWRRLLAEITETPDARPPVSPGP